MHWRENEKQSDLQIINYRTGHSPTYFKKITESLPVLCADMNFQCLNEVLWTKHNLAETDFMLTYPDAT